MGNTETVNLTFRTTARETLLTRSNRSHKCRLCDYWITDGYPHVEWTEPAKLGVAHRHAHDLCVRGEIVAPSGIFEKIGYDLSGKITSEGGKWQWWALIHPYQAQWQGGNLGWWEHKPSLSGFSMADTEWSPSALVWPPDLNAWLLSLDIPNWGSAL